ncbi:MAG: BON domain-containing protein [Candidatus Omnitrophota bacterium]
MESVEGLSNEELKELILEQLGELGIDSETVDITIEDGPKVSLRGKVDSERERGMIKQTIMDVVGIDDIIDELVVIEGVNNGLEDEESSKGAELYDEDKEYMGSEDAFRAVEDGVPYIPPTNPSYQGSPETVKRKKQKRKTP